MGQRQEGLEAALTNRIVFATLHLVGSSDDLAPWSGYDSSASTGQPRPDRIAESAHGRPPC
ncbi:hypothetical protein [Methylibium sp.]|uniref:hypothetical protein n=1 Tax=Methylibium sp. TaxID=2067992 RepID=UPI00184A237E|nr:hypothetical protein [Methylibium sp.]MBA3591799.1 hypothetical protein [Methylibium sp.]